MRLLRRRVGGKKERNRLTLDDGLSKLSAINSGQIYSVKLLTHHLEKSPGMLPAGSSNISATELKCGGKSCVSAYPMQGNSMRDKGIRSRREDG